METSKERTILIQIGVPTRDNISDYKKLSKDGEQTHPLENTFWGALFGGLTDKYGNHWLLNYDKKREPK